MSKSSFTKRLAVCSWSLQPEGPEQLVKQLNALGIPRVQIALDPLRTQPELWEPFPKLCAQNGIELISGMFVTVGEDYSSLESIRQTGGVVPDATWEENWLNIQACANLAERLNLDLVTFHAGFMPEDPSLPAYKKLQDRLNRIADAMATRNLELGLETGQETAEHLAEFLKTLQRPDVGVNFDPANMILYDKGDPISALRTLARWLKQCHIKDANLTQQKGTWGEEVTVGTGQVDWKGFFATLDEVGYDGYLAIEREAGDQRLEDIRTARRFVEGSLPSLG
jgi:sugar phosphate isomerase/epimerase